MSLAPATITNDVCQQEKEQMRTSGPSCEQKRDLPHINNIHGFVWGTNRERERENTSSKGGRQDRGPGIQQTKGGRTRPSISRKGVMIHLGLDPGLRESHTILRPRGVRPRARGLPK